MTIANEGKNEDGYHFLGPLIGSRPSRQHKLVPVDLVKKLPWPKLGLMQVERGTSGDVSVPVLGLYLTSRGENKRLQPLVW